MNGPSKVSTKSKVYTDPIGVENGLWPFRCPQRKLGIFILTIKHIKHFAKIDNCLFRWDIQDMMSVCTFSYIGHLVA